VTVRSGWPTDAKRPAAAENDLSFKREQRPPELQQHREAESAAAAGRPPRLVSKW
jgi:hypothetical protein